MTKIKTLFCLVLASIILSGCLPSEDTNLGPALPSKEELDQAFEKAVAAPKEFKNDLKETCPSFLRILGDVAETVQMGSRIWNAGGAPITIRIYEGAAYRILYETQYECPSLTHAFLGGLNRAAEAEDLNQKGITLRQTMDLVMGGPPAKPPGAP